MKTKKSKHKSREEGLHVRVVNSLNTQGNKLKFTAYEVDSLMIALPANRKYSYRSYKRFSKPNICVATSLAMFAY